MKLTVFTKSFGICSPHVYTGDQEWEDSSSLSVDSAYAICLFKVAVLVEYLILDIWVFSRAPPRMGFQYVSTRYCCFILRMWLARFIYLCLYLILGLSQ
jgi:hypothetical protein